MSRKDTPVSDVYMAAESNANKILLMTTRSDHGLCEVETYSRLFPAVMVESPCRTELTPSTSFSTLDNVDCTT